MIPNEETKEILYAIDKATSDINPVLSKAIDFTYKDADDTIKRLYGLIPPLLFDCKCIIRIWCGVNKYAGKMR